MLRLGAYLPLTPSTSSTLPSPATSPTLNASLTLISVWVDTKSYNLRSFLFHSTNSLSTYYLLPSPFYSSSCNKHTGFNVKP